MSEFKKHPGRDEKEIADLLKLKIEELEKLDFIEDSPEDESVQGFTGNEFASVPKGKEGLDILLKDSRLKKLKSLSEEKIDAGINITPLKEKIKQIDFKDRSEAYLNKTHDVYHNAIKTVEIIFIKLAKRNKIQNSTILDVIDYFMDVLVKDRNILINFSNFDAQPDDYLYQHAVNTSILSMNIATVLGYTRKEVIEIGEAGLLADIGMMLIPKYIRTKPDRLDKNEYYEIQKHPILGTQLLANVEGLSEAAACGSYQHHERLTGVGYPKNRTGRLIHKYSSIIAIADVYDAITSKRAHRPALHPATAIVQVFKMAKIGLLDLEIVKKILSLTSLYPVGCLVELSDKSIARVVDANEKVYDKPIVSVVIDKKGNILPREKMYHVNLLVQKQTRIEKPVPYADYNISDVDGF